MGYSDDRQHVSIDHVNYLECLHVSTCRYVSLAFLWRIRDQGIKRISADSDGGKFSAYSKFNTLIQMPSLDLFSASSDMGTANAHSLPHRALKFSHTDHVLHRSIRQRLSWCWGANPGAARTGQYHACHLWRCFRLRMGG